MSRTPEKLNTCTTRSKPTAVPRRLDYLAFSFPAGYGRRFRPQAAALGGSLCLPPSRSPHGPDERLCFFHLLGRHVGDERLPVPWRCDRLSGEHESVGGELDPSGFRSPPPGSDPLLDHLLNLLDV